MADSIPKFHDAAERSPIGGWHYYYNTLDRDTLFQRSSADEVIEELERYRRNNHTFTSRNDLEAEVWRYYCSRQPDRCGQIDAPANPQPFLPNDQKPEFFGPIIWRFLNLAATRFQFAGGDFFQQTIARVHDLMSCPTCREEWARILATNPTAGISTTLQACQWVNRVHNIVNLSKGKALYPYEQMVIDYGAPLPTP